MWQRGETMHSAKEHSLAEERALLTAVRDGSQEAFARLAARYDGMLSALSRQLVVPALDEDDLKQEGLLALLVAVRSFDETNGAPFSAYARLCARHRMISARRRVMALPLPVEEDDSVVPVFSAEGQAEPEQLVLAREEEETLFSDLKKRLSPLEYATLREYLDGYSYEEIAARIGGTPKSVDNALSRVRRKLQHRF